MILAQINYIKQQIRWCKLYPNCMSTFVCQRALQTWVLLLCIIAVFLIFNFSTLKQKFVWFCYILSTLLFCKRLLVSPVFAPLRYVPNVAKYRSIYETDRQTHRPLISKILNGHISATDHPIHFVFGSRVGFLEPDLLTAFHLLSYDTNWYRRVSSQYSYYLYRGTN